MTRRVAHVALVVRDYDEAIAFYCDKLGFELIADAPRENDKRWVLVGAPLRAFCSRGPTRPSRSPASEIRREGACRSSSTPTISGPTTAP